MGGVDKVMAPILGSPLIVHSVRPFQEYSAVAEIVLVTSADKVGALQGLAREHGWSKVTCVCEGGRRRQDSVRLGLERLSACKWVLVHDGARPCVDSGIILRALEAVERTGAAIAAVPVKDTVKVVSTDLMVRSTLRREELWAVQTPQAFDMQFLLEAHRHCQQDVTDDAAMVESTGGSVTVFMGSYENLKVTTPEDMTLVEAILRRRMEKKD
jgi:2-C-methyl-D-erythritol 4-phosphate cytidylyltransferase